MDRGTLLGFLLGIGLLAAAILIGGSPRTFLHPESMIVVFGGIIASTLIRFPLSHVTSAFAVASRAFFITAANPQNLVFELVGLSQRSRREGRKGLEKASPNDPFLVKGIQMVVDQVDKERIREMLSTEIHVTQERHATGQEIFKFIAGAAPSFGMVGTLIGMVQLFASIQEPTKMGPAMALSLLSTLWGAIIAYLVALPISGKLEWRSKEELHNMQIILEGVMGIVHELNPNELEEQLNVLLEPGDRASRRGGPRG